MASTVKTILDYLAGQVANLTKADDTADGETDDKHQDEPTQVAQIGAGSTDARKIANAVFGTGVRIPAELIVSGDAYDVTQSYTRMNTLYGMTRENFYEQSRSNVQVRKNRLGVKQQITSNVYQQLTEVKQAYNAEA